MPGPPHFSLQRTGLIGVRCHAQFTLCFLWQHFPWVVTMGSSNDSVLSFLSDLWALGGQVGDSSDVTVTHGKGAPHSIANKDGIYRVQKSIPGLGRWLSGGVLAALGS